MLPEQFSLIMKRCKEEFKVRYVSPVIHPRAKDIVAFTIWTSDETVEFSITNNPDEGFDLNKAVNEYLDELGGES